MEEWFLEYHIHKNRPGLLGDIASLLGMLSINIVTIGGAEGINRILLRTDDTQKISILRSMLRTIENITVTALRQPTLPDRLALRHGRFIRSESEHNKTYRFSRDELGILIDFLGELLKREGNQVIGVKGMPKVGKTEAIIAACVYSSKRWTFISSTMIRQSARTRLYPVEREPDNIVFLLDGSMTARASEDHHRVVKEVMDMDVPKVIENPDMFIQQGDYTLDIFDRIIELYSR